MSEPCEIAVPGAPPILAWRLRGDGSGPAAHLQAGVHADEIPGMLVLHKLLATLIADEAAGRLRGDVTVVPQCNPIGVAQFGHGRLLGRFDRATGQNFNRGFPGAPAREAEAGVFAWQAALLRLVGEASIVLDLHTDDEALPYVYLHAGFWPPARDLAACLGAEVAILWRDGGGGAFEDAVVQSWNDAGTMAGRLCATVELRGQADVSDGLARDDAERLHRLLCARGVVRGEAALPDWHGDTVPMGHVQTLRADVSGVVCFLAGLGDRLQAGEAFARLVPSPGRPEQDRLLTVPSAGRMFTRMRDRLVQAGAVVAKFTGDMPSASWADMPLDD